MSIAEALKAGLRAGSAADATYATALAGVRHEVHMTAAMGMDAQCEDAVSMLCMATGVYAPAPPGSKAEARQLQVRLASCNVFRAILCSRSHATKRK